MLRKILFKNKNNLQFIIATGGAFLGLVALLISVQLYIDIQNFHSGEEELFGPNSIVIQKKVTKFTSIGMNNTDFTEEDLETLRSKNFITDLASFESSDFRVGISEVPGDGLPHFYADMFFQSIPDRFMDVKVDWSWSDTSEYIPIVLPRSFIMLINYGIVQSQGLNQISEELLMAARLTIHMAGNGKSGKLIGRVVGFSQKINSILVPESFLAWANEKYGTNRKQNPNRLFITITDESYGELEKLMDEMNLDVSEGDITVAKIKTIITVIITIIGIAAILIITLSISGFIQYSQLMISKVNHEIKILLRLGYSVKTLVQTFLFQFLKIFGIIVVFASITMLLTDLFFIKPFLVSNGITVANSSFIIPILISLICFVFFGMLTYSTIKNTVFKLGKE